MKMTDSTDTDGKSTNADESFIFSSKDSLSDFQMTQSITNDTILNFDLTNDSRENKTIESLIGNNNIND